MFLLSYWSLGFQISRWGYKDLSEVKTVIERNKKIGLLQVIQKLDIFLKYFFKYFN